MLQAKTAHGNAVCLVDHQTAQLPIPVRRSDDGHPLGVGSNERFGGNVHDAFPRMAHLELFPDL
jgi:hypothetical protein